MYITIKNNTFALLLIFLLLLFAFINHSFKATKDKSDSITFVIFLLIIKKSPHTLLKFKWSQLRALTIQI